MKVQMDLFQLYEQHFFFEIQRKDELDGKLGMPVGVLTILIGGATAMATKVHAPWTAASLILSLALICVLLTAGVTVFYLIKAYMNPAYCFVSTLVELEHYRVSLEEYFRKVDTGETAEETFSMDMLHKYARAQDHNSKINDRKSKFLRTASGWLIATLVALTISAGPFLWLKLTEAEAIQKIQLVDPA